LMEPTGCAPVDLGIIDESGERLSRARIKESPLSSQGSTIIRRISSTTVQALHPAIRQNCGSRHSVPATWPKETLVIVQGGSSRTARNRIDPVLNDGSDPPGGNRSTRTVRERHTHADQDGSLPKTTSGNKIQRSLTRRPLARNGRLDEQTDGNN